MHCDLNCIQETPELPLATTYTRSVEFIYSSEDDSSSLDGKGVEPGGAPSHSLHFNMHNAEKYEMAKKTAERMGGFTRNDTGPTSIARNLQAMNAVMDMHEDACKKGDAHGQAISIEDDRLKNLPIIPDDESTPDHEVPKPRVMEVEMKTPVRTLDDLCPREIYDEELTGQVVVVGDDVFTIIGTVMGELYPGPRPRSDLTCSDHSTDNIVLFKLGKRSTLEEQMKAAGTKSKCMFQGRTVMRRDTRNCHVLTDEYLMNKSMVIQDVDGLGVSTELVKKNLQSKD